MKKTLSIVIIVVILVGLGIIWKSSETKAPVVVTNFEECAATGSPIMESYPRQCRYGNQTFVENVDVGILPFKSGIRGIISLGPTCPVVMDPPDPQCADRPYETVVQVIVVDSPGSSPFATGKTNKDGFYEMMLPPGKYALQPVGGQVFPQCETKEVTVEPDSVSEVNISCDTGIR